MKQQIKVFIGMILITLGMSTLHASTNTQEVENFVSRFYTEVLGRPADTAGLPYWTNRLVSGESTGADVATGFVFSDEFMSKPEFSDNTMFVTILYNAFFNRPADAAGLDLWTNKLEYGVSREDVLNGFLYSQEFTDLSEAYGIKAVPDGATAGASGGGVENFVKRFYSVVLGREADTAGLASWVDRLNTKVATGADIAVGFVFSPEFDEKSKDDITYLNVLYSAFFNREADDGGLNIWLSQLEQGMSREDVLNGFLHSNEFVNLCNLYDIEAYRGVPPEFILITKIRLEEFVTEYTYNNHGWLSEEIYEKNAGDWYKITYSYDTKGNMLKKIFSTDGITETFIYTYTSFGKISTMTIVEYGIKEVYTYNEHYKLTKVKSGDSERNYDEYENIISDYMPGQKIDYQYTYNTKGKIVTKYTKMINEGGLYELYELYAYNAHGDIASISRKNDVLEEYRLENTSNYNYDINNNLISETTGWGDIIYNYQWIKFY